MTSAPNSRFFVSASLVLALGTLALYLPTLHYPFINFDDNDYITGNPVVKAGLTWHGVVWAFDGIHVANWHPLTWLSHMLDCQLFGLSAGGHHLVNVLFHVANTLLLFTFLTYTTGAQIRSAMVAALFAWHPTHVESVAWISERKDVLCGFFWLLTLMAYARYAQTPKPANSGADEPPANQRSGLFYGLALAGCAGSLMSKPMAVTLPLTLLLLDVWPLNRIRWQGPKPQNSLRLLLEKVPFFLLSVALCAMTLLAQRGGGAVSTVDWGSRLGNVPVAYTRYLSKTFWPSDLAIVYPYVYHWPAMAIIGSIALLLVVSALALILWRRKSWFAVGWFWFLGTLIPVIGFMQVGAQSMADRYIYIPSIGLFVIIVWAASEYCAARLNGKMILSLIGGSALIGCVLATSLQITYWRNTVSLFLHARAVTDNNYVADNALGKAFETAGDLQQALAFYDEAVRIQPRYAVSQFNFAIALIGAGLKEQAFEHLVAAAKLDPANADAQFNLGIYFLQQENWTDAASCFGVTTKLRPEFAPAHYRLGQALIHLGKNPEALASLRAALALQPDLKPASDALTNLLAAHPELK